jgi:hypothetical protein
MTDEIMKSIDHHSHVHKYEGKWLMPGICLLVFFVCALIFQTLHDMDPPPVMFEESNAVGYAYGNGSTLVEYMRKVRRNSHVRVTLDRTVECGTTNLTYDLPPAVRERDAGEYKFNDKLLLPFHVAAGTKCKLITLVQYNPILSITTHSYYAPELDFIIVPDGPLPETAP